MRSRLEKYYNNDIDDNERIKKNKKIYDTIYRLDPLAADDNISTANEIELMDNIAGTDIKTRENYRRLKEYNRIMANDDKKMDPSIELKEEAEDKIYDINSILEKAKTEKGDQDDRDRYRKLTNTQFDILNGLNIGDKINVTEEETESDEERLKELINTITMNKRVLNDLSKKTQPQPHGELLSDLLPDEHTLVSGKVNDKVENNESLEQNKEPKEENIDANDLDKSFYTSTVDFGKDDFEDEVKDLESAVKVNGTLIKILLFILLVIITTVTLFILNNYVDLNLFKK